MNRDSWEDEENSSNLLLWSNLRAMGKLGEKMIMYSIFKWWRMHYLFQIKTDVVCNFVKSISWWKRVGFSDAGRVQVLFSSFWATFVCVLVLHSPRLHVSLQEISLCNIASHAFSLTKPHYISLPIADLANQSFHRFSALRQGIPFRYIPQKHQTWRRKNPRKEKTKAENTDLLTSFWLSFRLVWENIASLQCIGRQQQSVINTI